MKFQAVWRSALIAVLLDGVASEGVEGPNLRRTIDEESFVENQSHRRLGCNSKPLPTFDRSGVKPETLISFIALGDTPYSLRDRHCLNYQLRNIDLSKPNGPQFAIHVGDIKESSKKTPCDERLYSDISDIFSHPTNAKNYDTRNLFFVVGDNESQDCPKPAEAHQLWMKYFGPNNEKGFGTLSGNSPKVYRQKNIDGMDRSENFAFYKNNVLFLGVNIIGGRERGDEPVRLVQNFKWVKNQMAYYSKRGMKAAVIMGHGVLKPGGFHYTYFANDLFAFLRRNRFKDLPVAYLHGDGHDFCVKYPAPDTNYVDIMVDEGGYANPILVSVLRDPVTDQHIFSVDRRGGLYSPGAASEDIPDCPLIEHRTWNVTLPEKEVPENQLTWKGLNPKKPLKACHGNCKDDSSCRPGLKCMIRNKFEAVPGCSGKGRKGMNYCYEAEPQLKFLGVPPHSPNSLGLCEGHCKRDGDCESDLYCFKRKRFAAVPGCSGNGRRDKNYCVRRSPNSAPEQGEDAGNSLTYVGEGKHQGLLDACQGDCDEDSDCKPGLKCMKRDGTEAVPGCVGEGESKKDYCYEPPEEKGEPELFTFERSKFGIPLGNCQGDCDDDSECQPGLLCFRRQTYEKVPGCLGKGVFDKDYCYYPNT